MKDRYWAIIGILSLFFLIIPIQYYMVFGDSTGNMIGNSYYMVDASTSSTQCSSTIPSISYYSARFLDLYLGPSTTTDSCIISFAKWTLPIPTNATINSATITYNVQAINSPKNCDWVQVLDDVSNPFNSSPTVQLAQLWYDSINNPVYISNDSTCTVAGSHTITLGANAVQDLQNSLSSNRIFSISVRYHDMTRDGVYHQQAAQNLQNSDIQLNVVYTVPHTTSSSPPPTSTTIINSISSYPQFADYIISKNNTKTILSNSTGSILYSQSSNADDALVIQKAIDLSVTDSLSSSSPPQLIGGKAIVVLGNMNIYSTIKEKVSDLVLYGNGIWSVNIPSGDMFTIGETGGQADHNTVGSSIHLNYVKNIGSSNTNAVDIVYSQSNVIEINRALGFNSIFYDYNNVGHFQQYNNYFTIHKNDNNAHAYYHAGSTGGGSDFTSGSTFTLDATNTNAVYLASGSADGAVFRGFINTPDSLNAIQDYGGGSNVFDFSYVTEAGSHFADGDILKTHAEQTDAGGDRLPDVPSLASGILHQNSNPFRVQYSIEIQNGVGTAFVENQYNNTNSLIQVDSGSYLHFTVEPYHSYKITYNGNTGSTSAQRLTP